MFGVLLHIPKRNLPTELSIITERLALPVVQYKSPDQHLIEIFALFPHYVVHRLDIDRLDLATFSPRYSGGSFFPINRAMMSMYRPAIADDCENSLRIVPTIDLGEISDSGTMIDTRLLVPNVDTIKAIHFSQEAVAIRKQVTAALFPQGR